MLSKMTSSLYSHQGEQVYLLNIYKPLLELSTDDFALNEYQTLMALKKLITNPIILLLPLKKKHKP